MRLYLQEQAQVLMGELALAFQLKDRCFQTHYCLVSGLLLNHNERAQLLKLVADPQAVTVLKMQRTMEDLHAGARHVNSR